MIDQYEEYDALGLAELVERGEVAPAELVEAAWRRIDARNPKINAVVWEDRERTLLQLQEGLPVGPFRGVPLIVKDSGMPIAGFVLTGGSRFFRGAIQQTESELTTRMRKAGFAFIGMGTSPEFGMNCTAEAAVYGEPTRNPWDLSRSAGGSSGGSAAAVAAGIVPMAGASDAAGSIRIPASACGIFGLKPSRGRMPAGPIKGEGLAGIATWHAVSRSVRDNAAMLDALSGVDAGAPYAAPAPDGDFLKATRTEPGRLRIGLVESAPNGAAIDPECKLATQRAGALCVSLGHSVEPTSYPDFDYEQLSQALMLLGGVGAASAVDARAAALGRQPSDDELEMATRTLIAQARNASALDYSKAVSYMHLLGRKLADRMQAFDVLLTPTLLTPPAPIGKYSSATLSASELFKRLDGYMAFLSLANAAGSPAMSVPLHWTETGLPVGVHFMASLGQERLLLSLAAQLERAQPWFHRRPPLATNSL